MHCKIGQGVSYLTWLYALGVVLNQSPKSVVVAAAVAAVVANCIDTSLAELFRL